MSKFIVTVKTGDDVATHTVDAHQFQIERDVLIFLDQSGQRVAAFLSWNQVLPDSCNENVELKKYQTFFEIIKSLTVKHDTANTTAGEAVVYVDKLDKALQSVDPKWFDTYINSVKK